MFQFFSSRVDLEHTVLALCVKHRTMPFLDTLVTPQEDGTLTTSVYRKATDADLDHQWDRHHVLACKHSVINTLTHRAKAVCANSNSTSVPKRIHT